MELLALKWAVSEKFKEYLLGRHTVVWTDSNPVVHLQTAKLGATEQRWAAQLAAFDIDIRYHAGRTNKCADALSRNPPIITIAEMTAQLQASSRGICVPVELQSVHSVQTHTDCKARSDEDTSAVSPSVLPSYSHAQLQRSDDIYSKKCGICGTINGILGKD